MVQGERGHTARPDESRPQGEPSADTPEACSEACKSALASLFDGTAQGEMARMGHFAEGGRRYVLDDHYRTLPDGGVTATIRRFRGEGQKGKPYGILIISGEGLPIRCPAPLRRLLGGGEH